MSLATLMLFSLIMAFQPGGQDQDEIDRYLEKAYPPAPKGMVRYVLRLPHKTRAEEGSYRVQIQVGKMMMTDGVNKQSVATKIEEKVAKGWGFNYYEVKKIGPGMSTLIGVPPGTKKVKRFVGGQPKMIRYNSRLPVVVYVPKDAEVRYQIFRALKPKKMKKG